MNDEHIRGSNLSEILRILLTSRPQEDGKIRETIGIRPFLKLLSETPAPSSLVRDPYWQRYVMKQRVVDNQD